MQKVDSARLTGFLAKALENHSYAFGAPEKVLQGGRRLIGPWHEGDLSYEDTYVNTGESGLEFTSFEGTEYVRQEGKSIWERHYRGGITNPDFMNKEAAEEVFDVLKQCMREFPRDKPFMRGPKEKIVVINGRTYVYKDIGPGDIDDSKCVEWIVLGIPSHIEPVYSLVHRAKRSMKT